MKDIHKSQVLPDLSIIFAVYKKGRLKAALKHLNAVLVINNVASHAFDKFIRHYLSAGTILVFTQTSNISHMKNSNDSILLTLALIAIDMELKAILEEDLQQFRAKQAGHQLPQPVQQAA